MSGQTIIALATCVAAFSACAGAWCAYKAAVAAKRQGDAAWEQVSLQRPRPVVIVKGCWSLENPTDEPSGFLLQNVGSSPAFDVEVSDIEGPLLKQVQYRERLTTNRIFVLTEGKEPLEATHHRHMPGNVIDHQAVSAFVQNASRTFSRTDEGGNPSLDHKLKFFVKYSALDSRPFMVKCSICFNLGINSLHAKIEPDSSWLG